MKFGLKAFFIILLTACFCIYPPVRNYKQNNIKAAFDYFAPDAFYYLNVADKFQKTGFSSYDGKNPTNGFHPLWQFILNYSFSKIERVEDRLTFVFLLSVTLVTLGFIFLSIALLRFFNSFPLTLLGLIPGCLFLLFSFILFPFATPWSFMNGMETPLSIFLFGLLILVLSYSDELNLINRYKLITISILLTLIGFARLDDFFLLPTFLIFVILKSEKKNRLINTLLVIFLPVISITVYLIYNMYYSGLMLPVSGIVKSNFSFDNLTYTFSALFSVYIKDNFFGEHSYWAGCVDR